MEKFAVFTDTQEDYTQLMEWADSLGFTWGGQKANSRDYFKTYGESTVVYFRTSSKRLTYSDASGYDEERSEVTRVSMEEFAIHHGLQTPLPDDFF